MSSVKQVFMWGGLLTLISFPWLVGRAEDPPTVGDVAPDFELKMLNDQGVKLSPLAEKGPVVLLFLRGYPGYQCPLCTKQVGEFVAKAEEFAQAKTQMILVYPGAAEKLSMHAREFITGKTFPDNVHFVIDPDYKVVTAYNLRWDAPNETAYPSTFVLNTERKIVFAKISKTHGGRTKAADVLAEVQKLK